MGRRLFAVRRAEPNVGRLLAAGGVVVALGIGVVAGRASSGRATSKASAVPPVAPTPAVPAKPAAPVSVGYSPVTDRSKAGAAASAVLFVERGASLVSDPQAVEADWSAALRRQTSSMAPALQAMRGSTIRTAPVGYSVTAYSPDRAVVSVWTVSVLSGPQTQVQALWGTGSERVVWEGGRWRYDGTAAADQSGPTPPLAADPSSPTELAAALAATGVTYALP